MAKVEALNGNQAVARGFWEAGGRVAASYPGSPTVEIMESLHEYQDIYSEWSVNEKVALEVAIGASAAGGRALVSMKHVGINIAADPLMTYTQVDTPGGLLLVVGDDPGLTSSQNEQDSRFWGRFANMPVLEPASPREVKQMVGIGLEISEHYGTPVLLKLTTRLCHSRGPVELAERKEHIPAGFEPDQSRFCMLPPYANKQQYFMKERLEKLQADVRELDINCYIPVEGADTLLITSGISHNYVKELNPSASICKLGLVWPVPVEEIRTLSAGYKRVLVVEELLGLIEEVLNANGIAAKGKDFFPFTGELTIDVVREGLQQAGLVDSGPKAEQPEPDIPARAPILCSGCPHRPVFHILKRLRPTVIGDIGCYSLGILEPFEVSKTNISMGACLGMVKGMAELHHQIGNDKPLVAIIGDGTGFHSGLPGFVNLRDTQRNITLVIMDNRTTAMTGGQDNAGTGVLKREEDSKGLSFKTILNAMGIENVREVDQFKYKEALNIFREEIKRPGLSVIITTRPCALNFKIREPRFYVDPKICINCRSCISVNCPPIHMRKYTGIEEKKSFIVGDMCVGCSVCSQVCPVGAIKRVKGGAQ
ncbi:MAG: indolepyruvate ferredoxin oxidoreductase [Firmicutes bacterium]|nr:indolepyruvate ferredoxin oxidoreductase [Bacillota bacterium]